MPRGLGRLRRELMFLLTLSGLPREVALFQWRARRLASRSSDEFSFASATTSRKLSTLLSLARDRRHVVELGTATGWTSISLLLAEPERTVAQLGRRSPGGLVRPPRRARRPAAP